MPFTHSPIDIPEIAKQISIDGNGPRLYQTPSDDVYPSITEVLSVLSEEAITKWKNRVGQKVAQEECDYALGRGNDIHELAEQYLKNTKDLKLSTYPINTRLFFSQMKPELNQIDNILVQETPLYSDFFRIAGRCDCIADYKGILSVIDFKGSKKAKQKDHILSYLYQTAFYAYAFYERTKIQIPQTVILMANEQGGMQVFIEKPQKWWKELIEIRKKWLLKYPTLIQTLTV